MHFFSQNFTELFQHYFKDIKKSHFKVWKVDLIFIWCSEKNSKNLIFRNQYNVSTALFCRPFLSIWLIQRYAIFIFIPFCNNCFLTSWKFSSIGKLFHICSSAQLFLFFGNELLSHISQLCTYARESQLIPLTYKIKRQKIIRID